MKIVVDVVRGNIEGIYCSEEAEAKVYYDLADKSISSKQMDSLDNEVATVPYIVYQNQTERPYKKYDVVLVKKSIDDALSCEDVYNMLYSLKSSQFYPLDFKFYSYSCVMGFISSSAADDLYYTYDELEKYIAYILGDMCKENKSEEYEFHGLSIYLTR